MTWIEKMIIIQSFEIIEYHQNLRVASATCVPNTFMKYKPRKSA